MWLASSFDANAQSIALTAQTASDCHDCQGQTTAKQIFSSSQVAQALSCTVWSSTWPRVRAANPRVTARDLQHGSPPSRPFCSNLSIFFLCPCRHQRGSTVRLRASFSSSFLSSSPLHLLTILPTPPPSPPSLPVLPRLLGAQTKPKSHVCDQKPPIPPRQRHIAAAHKTSLISHRAPDPANHRARRPLATPEGGPGNYTSARKGVSPSPTAWRGPSRRGRRPVRDSIDPKSFVPGPHALSSDPDTSPRLDLARPCVGRLDSA